MVSKRHISYKWRIFLPSAVCLWAVIFVMFQWQSYSVKQVRDEMAFDQLDVIGERIVDQFVEGDTASIRSFALFASRYFDEKEEYDPLTIWVLNIDDNSPDYHYGRYLRPGFNMPIGRSGTMMVPNEYINNDDDKSQTPFLYSVYSTPDTQYKVYVMLPYTKRLVDNISARETYYWLIFMAIGLFVTILLYISISYFGRNIQMLKMFSYQASTNPDFVPPADIKFSNDELGDISRQILDIYNQRMQEIERNKKEHEVALAAIEEKNRMKRELTSNVNHELKTPVGVIQGYIDTLVDNPDMDPEVRCKFLEKTKKSVTRLVNLIKDVTEVTRLDSGGKLVNLQVLNMHDLVFQFDSMLKDGNVLQGRMTFEYDIPLDCKVFGNESLLQTMLTNFVKNALSYSGGTECRLIMLSQDEDTVTFKFHDNGVGVAPEHLQHIFNRFYRLNNSRSRASGGTGLGLAIVEASIKSFGGTIQAMNHFPSGLAFIFTLHKRRPANLETNA